VAVRGLAAVARAFVIAVLLFAGVASGFGAIAGLKSAQALALGLILVLGVAYLVAQGFADAAPAVPPRRAAAACFVLHRAACALWGTALPVVSVGGALEWGPIVLALVPFGLVALVQALFPLWAHHPAAAWLRAHLVNGF
jgi:NAD(P)H-quinone oxidoreductase subunit 5